MSKKGENIFKRKDGRWEARYVKGYDLSGKIRYGFCYGKTYKEAKEKVSSIKAALMNNGPLPTSGRSQRLAFFAEEWLRLQKSRVKESTYIKYETVISRHILPKLGGYLPLSMNTQLVETFKQELTDEGLAVNTIKSILMVLRSVLNYASSQLAGTFPNIEIHSPKEMLLETRVLSLEEQRKLTAFLREDMDECKFGILLAMLTGLRIGELCALRWGNVYLQQRTIKVEATMQRLKNTRGNGGSKTRVVIEKPKSAMSIRAIPMSDSAVELCEEITPRGPAAFILTGTMDYMEPRAVQYRFEKYTKACGLEGVHFHTLRHTFATRCIEVGFELKSLSEVLGHSSTSITMSRYVHSSFDLKRENMSKLSAIGF